MGATGADKTGASHPHPKNSITARDVRAKLLGLFPPMMLRPHIFPFHRPESRL